MDARLGSYICQRLTRRLRSRALTTRRGAPQFGFSLLIRRIKAASMPANHGFWVDDRDGIQKRRKQWVKPNQTQSIEVSKPHP